ncbi:MAG: hypothetical protein V4560_07460 [Bacteroidota bacterium]
MSYVEIASFFAMTRWRVGVFPVSRKASGESRENKVACAAAGALASFC